MKSTRKNRSHSCFLAAATVAVLTISVPARPVAAQPAYPERGLVLIVPYPAGGGTSVAAICVPALSARAIGGSRRRPPAGCSPGIWRSRSASPSPLRIRAGGGGWLGWGALAAAPADGYTIGYLNVPSLYAGYLDPRVGRRRVLDSFTPLTNHVLDYNIWAVKTDSAFRTLADVIDAAKKESPRKHCRHRIRRWARRDDHLAILSIQAEHGGQVRHRPHAAVLPMPRPRCWVGTCRCWVPTISEVAEEVRAGQLRVLGVMATRRALPFSARRCNLQASRALTQVCVGLTRRRGAGRAAQGRGGEAHRLLEKTLSSEEHRKKADALSLEISLVAGEQYRKFLRDNEQSTKKLMGWLTDRKPAWEKACRQGRARSTGRSRLGGIRRRGSVRVLAATFRCD